MRQLLLQAQAWWDAQRFDQPGWHVAQWRDQKVRHIQLHVAKALGKVVAAWEAGAVPDSEAMARVRDEVLPDVAIYRSQLINTMPDCGTLPALLHRPGTAIAIWPAVVSPRAGAPDGEVLWRVILSLSRASATLAAYIEPREHGAGSSVASIQEAIQDLHDSAAALAAYFAVDLTQAHQARLQALLGAPLPPCLIEPGSQKGLEA